jgi:hypothetical protein
LAHRKDRKKDTVKKFLKTIPKMLRKTIKAVCSDMYEGFVKAAFDIFAVAVYVSRCNKAKLYRKSLVSKRKSFITRLKEELPLAPYKELKNVMWICCSNLPPLDYFEAIVLILLFKHSPTLKLAYHLSNDLTCIFLKDISKFGSPEMWVICF